MAGCSAQSTSAHLRLLRQLQLVKPLGAHDAADLERLALDPIITPHAAAAASDAAAAAFLSLLAGQVVLLVDLDCCCAWEGRDPGLLRCLLLLLLLAISILAWLLWFPLLPLLPLLWDLLGGCGLLALLLWVLPLPRHGPSRRCRPLPSAATAGRAGSCARARSAARFIAHSRAVSGGQGKTRILLRSRTCMAHLLSLAAAAVSSAFSAA